MTVQAIPVDLLLVNLKLKPSMFFLDGSFAQYVAFFSGFNVSSEATEIPLLEGFTEWITARTRSGYNLTWPALVLWSIWPEWNGSVSDWRKLDATSDKEAVRVLFKLLGAFKGVDPAAPGPTDTEGAP
ncbi:hypothetical protein [Kitasatospora kifunensis]|uniref:Uncharacterized protein n=1 Tax=Kitasatospora kifunensis TaxID=58351 RepID=A0A7W7VUQ6_KITKI|nr:hypothetical protein [Kitasatospora kifunensis]MBB4922725.1 hypothetical protein [Kitasatospora kifunensis]